MRSYHTLRGQVCMGELTIGCPPMCTTVIAIMLNQFVLEVRLDDCSLVFFLCNLAQQLGLDARLHYLGLLS